MIFVVEDDHGVRELELYALRQSGYEAEGYETPTAFRQALEKTVPDCVLLDVMLPGEDGLSLLRFLRRDARTRRVPVILVTARDAEMDKVKCWLLMESCMMSFSRSWEKNKYFAFF